MKRWKSFIVVSLTSLPGTARKRRPRSITQGPHGMLAGDPMSLRFLHKLGASLLSRRPLCGGVRGEAYASTFGTAHQHVESLNFEHDCCLWWIGTGRGRLVPWRARRYPRAPPDAPKRAAPPETLLSRSRDPRQQDAFLHPRADTTDRCVVRFSKRTVSRGGVSLVESIAAEVIQNAARVIGSSISARGRNEAEARLHPVAMDYGSWR
jgi:hypothetical protein